MNRAAKRTAKEKKAQDQKESIQDLSSKKTRRVFNTNRDTVITRAVEKAQSEDSFPPSGEHTPTTARNLRNEWRFDSAPSNTSSLKKLSAATEQRDESKKARDDTSPSSKEESE